MQKNEKYKKKYTILNLKLMRKKYSVGFYTGGLKLEDWENSTEKEKENALSKSWYLFWSFRNPKTQKLERQRNYKGGVNYFKTKKERVKALKESKSSLIRLIDKGFTPIVEEDKIYLGQEEEMKTTTVKEAFAQALDHAKLNISKKTHADYSKSANVFIRYLGKDNYNKDVNLITKKIVIKFLNEILKKTTARTRNNYKADLSALYSVMEKKLLIIENNFIKSIEKEKTAVKRNRTLTNDQLKKVTDYLRLNDPLLLLVVKFVSYNFLRPIEVCRLKIKDINIKDGLLYYQAKNKPLKTKRIPSILLDDLKKLKLDTYNDNYFLITLSGIPSDWGVDDVQRRSSITKRFTRIKKDMLKDGIKLDAGDNIYSFRHSYITNLFRFLRAKENLSFNDAIKELMPITGHDSESGLKNYIHSIDADIPKDWSEKIEFIF